MNKFAALACVLGASVICTQGVRAGFFNNNEPTTFLGPSASLQIVGPITDTSTYAILGEGGVKNLRLGGTLGYELTSYQYFKISAEYLAQKLTYTFFTGNEEVWVQQGAFGMEYMYLFSNLSLAPYFTLGGYLSHAPSKSLSNWVVTTRAGDIVTDKRRIAGSNADGASLGIGLWPWCGANAELLLNYDDIRYSKIYSSNGANNGLGGTFIFNQSFRDIVSLNLQASVRQPFNFYYANVAWIGIPNWSLGVFGDYVTGKHDLANSYDVGLSAQLALDRECNTTRTFDNKNERNFKGEVPLVARVITAPINPVLKAWSTDPAVYMPRVLAIKDEQITVKPGCTQGPPVILAPIPPMSAVVFPPITAQFPVGSYFGNTENSTYTVDLTIITTNNPPDIDLPAYSATIDNTGLITYYPGAADTFFPLLNITFATKVTVKGPGNCGSVSQTFDLTIFYPQ